jgi:hypothetical protein
MDDITVDNEDKTPPPKIHVMSLAMKTIPNPKTNANEIVMLSGLVNQQGERKFPRKFKENSLKNHSVY